MKLRKITLLFATAGALALGAAPAQAVHLFPVTPVFDPLGHDCAKALDHAPAASPAAEVLTVGFSFLDIDSGTSTTSIGAGDSVTWAWLADQCHSVTFSVDVAPDPDQPDRPPTTTQGAAGFMPAQPELVRWDSDGGHHYSLTFPAAGTYSYYCVHHASVGMTGTVEVAPATGA